MYGFSLTRVINLLEKANNQDVNISFLKDELSVQVQKGKKIDSSLLEELKENKPFLIHYFKNFANTEYKPDLPPIQKIPRQDNASFPLSYSQERLWFIDQLEGSAAYHLPTVLRLQGQLNTAALQAALAAIVQRHEVLHTVFYEQGGQVYQSIKQGGNWQLQLVDGATYNNNEDALKKYIEALIRTPFDLSQDFPVRATLIRLNNNEQVLAVTIHHIASDAWSVAVMVQELLELYDAFATERTPVLAFLPIQYADYAVWQRNYLQGDVLDKKIAYWKRKLDGVETLKIPATAPRVIAQSTTANNFNFYIDKEKAEGLLALCRQQGVTLFMALLSVYKVLLYRYSGQSDICVGTSLASRQQQELEGLIGFFVNTLALRDEINPDASFITLLQQVRTTTLDAYEHQDVPFEKVVEAVVKERDPNRSPLFQVMLVLANTPPAAELRLGEVVLSQENYGQEAAKFDITFFINQAADGLYGTVQYAANLYDATIIERMAEHFVTLINSAIKNPAQAVGLLPMLSSMEENQLLHNFNNSQVAYPIDISIVDLFEEQVATKPQSTALVFEEETFTYAQLNERSNQLAHYLKSKGVQPGHLVPLYMERSADMLIGILGILKAGAAYVPVDTALPADRLRYLLQDTNAKLIVCHAHSTNKLELEPGIEIIDINDTHNQPTGNLSVKPVASDLGYVIYTSGSTGTPKGVMITHRNLADYYYGLDQQVQISKSSSFALVSTIATDLGNTVLFGSLLSGGALHVFSKESVSNIEYLHNYFSSNPIDCLKIVPSHWKALCTDEALLLPRQLLVFGGEALPAEVVESIQQSGSTCRIVNHYGPTETTIGKLLHPVALPKSTARGSTYGSTIPIGKPFSNTQVYVLTKGLQLCPVGVPGQLYIAGHGLANGYLNNPELTKKKFIPNPFTTIPTIPSVPQVPAVPDNHQNNSNHNNHDNPNNNNHNNNHNNHNSHNNNHQADKEGNHSRSRMYATGDRVLWLADGSIQFIGRVDDQVKIRGYRVEPGEVSSVLLQHEDVKTGVVLASPDKQGNQRLVAYIVPQYPYSFERDSLLSYLKEQLPDYMVPSVLITLEEMPLTANGKIDRRALPDADAAEQGNSGGYVAPRNETEAKLAAIWADVLEEEEVSVEADFFELGGHSLLAVRLVSAIRKAFAVEMPIGDIFDYPTVALLATRLSQQAAAPLLPPITVIQPRPEHIPLSFSQERLWFIDQLGGSMQYHIPSVVRLLGQVDTAALSNALEQIVLRHEVLRTVIIEKEGQPYQVIKAIEGWHLQTVDGTAYHEDQQGLQQYLQQYISCPFNLSTDYPVRAVLIKLEKEAKKQESQTQQDGLKQSEHPEEYVLAVVLHHIASDGYSTPVMVQELVELYNAAVEQRPALLQVLPVQYADYALWQRNYLQGDLLAEKLQYWKDNLSGVATLQLPTDYPRPPVQSTRGAITSFQINKELSDQLQALSQQHGVTMFMTLLSAFNVLLYRYSGQQDICVGTPTAGREQAEVEGLIGFFINTLALRSQVEGSQPFTQLLQQVKQMTLAAYEHQQVPFEKVVEAVVKERDMSRSPLFQVMLVLQNTPEVAALHLNGISVSAGTGTEGISTHHTAKFDLTFNVTETREELYLAIEYSTELYQLSSIQRLADHFCNLLQSVIANPEQSVGKLSLLSQVEKEELLVSFNATQVAYPNDKTIIDLFEDQANRTPDKIAVVFEEEALTYIELNRRSNQLAHYLIGKGVVAETLVPICIERSIEMIVGILGILKAGGAYVPIDPQYPEDRINYMLQDAKANIVVSSKESRLKLPLTTGIDIIEIDGQWDTISQQPSTPVITNLTAHHLAYVIYTSGSTGRPKGVMIEHTSVINLLLSIAAEVQFTDTSIFLSVTTFSFDICYLELFMPLIIGGKLILVKSNATKDGIVLAKNINNYHPTHMQGTPSTWQLLIDAEWENNEAVKILVGGEVLKEDLKLQLTEKGNVWNVYGPTETTIWSTIKKMKNDQKVLIGRPLNNTNIQIVNKEGQLCPIGVAGEILIGGAGVARGYFNRPELTAEKFISNPYAKEPQERLYKTGDLGRWLPDGDIGYLGRADEQVKIRGYRIELGEIETVLQNCELVKQAAVAAKEDGLLNKQLVAYIVPQGVFDREGIIRYLQAKLPTYMVPQLWVEMESLPLTPNGKINRKALPDPDISTIIKDNYEAPANETEAGLVKIWQALLGIERIGVQDNFFELGGHSLLAMRLVSFIRKEWKIEIAIRNVFDYPTVAALAPLIVQNKQLLLPVIEAARPRPEHIPLSFSQERLWFIDQLGGSLQYHLPAVLRLKGMLDTIALSNALKEIINRHEVLRTVVRQEEGQPYQFVKEIKDKNAWQLQMVEGDVYKEDWQALQHYIEQSLNAPFHLSDDYMLRATLIRLGEEEHILVAVLHHIASDAWSNAILVQELVELYNASIEQRPATLPLLPVQYADYAFWQRNYLQGDVLAEKLQYWKEQLAGVSTLQLPTDYSRPLVQSTRGAITSFQINKDLSDQLQTLSQQHGVTLFMTLLSAFNVLLYRYSGQQDICVGTPIAGREQAEVEGLIGFFVNTFALRSQVDGSQPFTQLLQQVKQMTLAAYEHQQVPFEKVVEAIVKERDMSRSPLFQVMLVLQNMPNVAALAMNGVEVSAGIEGSSTHHTAKFDLTFNVTETAQGLYLAVEYSTELYRQESIEQMAAHFSNLLQSVVKSPVQSIGTLPLLSYREEEQLLQTFNATQTAYPKEKTIIDLFEEQLSKTPDSTAIIFEEQTLTYKELNEQANQLARYLREKGVREETLVPICIERSIEMMVGILGILKAGGAYVPIDPQYPEDRIRYMLEDTKASIVVSSRESEAKLSSVAEIDIIEIDSEWAAISQQQSANLVTAITPHHLAYVIYTSGSTGRPKGVLVEHGNVVSLVCGTDYVTLTNQDTLLSTGSSSFDATTFEYYSMLLHGGQLVLCTENKLLDHQSLKEEINNRAVTLMWFTSSWFNQLIETDITLFENLQTILAGGEKLSAYHVEKLRQTYPHIAIINGYGPTENTTFSLTYRVIESSINRPLPIGKPLSNRSVLLLDAYGQLVPIGVAGEICVGGAGLSRGYLNNEALTKEKFIANPYSNKAGATARLYKTGDIGRQLPDGNIEYLGRRDEQVKIRGYRIELGEIEAVLQQHEAVKQAVVVARENREGNKQLVAYIVKTNDVFIKEEMIAYTSSQLPAYMIPQVWIELDKLPLTANGKIDRKALPEVDIRELTAGAYEAPRNEMEIQLAQIWQQLLGIDEPGIHDNFFELGGDSVLTIQVVNRAKRIGYDLQTRDMFAYQTIARLSEAISNRLTNVILGEQGLLTGSSGLLPIQQWYLEESGGQAVSHFNQTVIIGIDKAISSAMLNTALQQLIEQHDALRFRYYQKDGEWHQEYGAYTGSLITEDLRNLKKQKLGPVITEKANTYQASLDIEKGDLLRMVWMQTPTAEKQNRLLIIIHHLVIDGVSWRILIENLEFLLTGIQSNQLLQLGNKSSSYRQWYQALQQYGQRQSVISQISYWEKVLGSYQPLIVNKEYEEKVQAKNISNLVMSLEPEQTARLIHDVPKTYHTEINDILLCALAITLRNWGGIDKIVVGLEGHGREEIAKNIDTSQTVGWFTSLYPVLIETGIGQPVEESIQSVKKQLRLVPDKGLGFGVLKYINKEKRLSEKPRWNIVFNYLGQLDTIVQEGKLFGGAGESAGQSMSDDQQVNEQLSVNGFVRGGELILTWNYNKKNFEKDTINDLINTYKETLEMLIEHCIEQQKSGVVYSLQDEEAGAILPLEKGNGALREINYKYLIPIRATGKKIPLYIVAGGGGTAHKFLKFSKMLDADQPVYILQAPDDAKSLRKFPETIEKMAAVFLEEVLLHYPEGPYALSGHCTGGLIAYEMARQLKAKGKKIHMVAMFDTIANRRSEPIPASLKNFYHIPAYLKSVTSKTILKFDFEMFLLRKYTRKAIGYKIRSLKKILEKTGGFNHENQMEYINLGIFGEASDIYVAAHRKYVVNPYDGSIVAFYAKDRYYFSDANRKIRYKKIFLSDRIKNMWQEYTAGVTIYDVEGDHSEMFGSEWGDTFARQLQYYLDNGS